MARIYPNSREDVLVLARALLDVAGEKRHDEVRTTTDGGLGLAFDVPDDLAALVSGVDSSRVVQPMLGVPDGGGSEEPTAGGETSRPTEVGETRAVSGVVGAASLSAVTGTEVSGVDKRVDGFSQRSATSRRRSSRSG